MREVLLDLHTRRFRLAAAIQGIQEMIDYLDAHCRAETSYADRRGKLVEELAEQDRRTQALEKVIVAATRLSAVASEQEFYTALEEIMGPLLACESYAVVLTPATGAPRVLNTVGVEAEQANSLIAQLAQERNEPPAVVRSVPLMEGTRSVGLLVIHELMPEKRELDTSDLSLLNMMSTAAGSLLNEYCATQG